MAALSPSATARWKYAYQNPIGNHSVTVRTGAGVLLAAVDDILTTLFGVIGAGCVESEVTEVSFAPIGSDVFDVVSGSSLAAFSFGSGSAIKQYDATSITFVGRSAGGRRVRQSLFGWKADLSEFRLLSEESSDVLTYITALNDVSCPLIAINGNKPVWHPYGDIKANDHYVDKYR